MITTEPVVADRLLLVSVVMAEDWVMELSETVMVRPGQQHWIEGNSFHLRSPNGQTRVVAGRGYRLRRT